MLYKEVKEFPYLFRYTSPRLAAAAVHGVMALKGTAKEFGIMTTPMLHFCVKCRNDNTYGTPTEEGEVLVVVLSSGYSFNGR